MRVEHFVPTQIWRGKICWYKIETKQEPRILEVLCEIRDIKWMERIEKHRVEIRLLNDNSCFWTEIECLHDRIFDTTVIFSVETKANAVVQPLAKPSW